MSTQPYLEAAKNEFKKTCDHLKGDYAKLQIGRASATLIEDVKVEAYGTLQPLKAVASISCPDSKTIQIQPWDKANLSHIETAIKISGLNFNPINDGTYVRINIPALTEERRAELTKLVNKMAEDARIAIRNARQTAHEAFKKLEADKKISEDDNRLADKNLQSEVDKFNKEIEDLAKAKESDIMKI
ncbi:ribosome recycling factor [Candidatus Peregrinibacteria bacterium]|nr:ribosome recycling factor [Candidatus Peregrinibacteria bacterium]